MLKNKLSLPHNQGGEMENFVLKTKNVMKRIAAIGIGAVMAGATMGAAFAQLENYPSPFVKDNKFVGLIVVGAAAAPADVIGATDIAATLAQSVSVTPGTTTVSGGKMEELEMNEALNTAFAGPLDDADLAGLQDTTLNIDVAAGEKDYNVHDELNLSATPVVETGTTATSPSEDYADKVFLEVAKGDIDYVYAFDDALGAINLTGATSDYPIELTFLGKKLSITATTATSITAQVAEEYYLNYGDTVTVDGKTVKLVNVGSGATSTVLVSVDGTQGTVSGTTTTKINGLRFKIKSVFSSDTPAERAATLYVGPDVSKVYENGDEYIGQPDKDYEWEWVLATVTSATPVIGIQNAQTYDDSDEVFYMPGEIKMPGDFIKINLQDLNVNTWQTYTGKVETEELYNSTGDLKDTSESVLKIEANGNDDGFTVGTDKTDVIYLATSGTGSTAGQVNVYWEDPDDGNHGKFYAAYNQTALNTTGVKWNFEKTSVDMQVIGTISTDFNMSLNFANQDPTLHVALAGGIVTHIGSVKDDATANDVKVAAVDVSNWDASTLTQDGVRLVNIESGLNSNKFVWELPEADATDFTANVLISSTGTSVTGGGVSGTLAGVAVAKLDSEITDPKAMPLLLVGDSAVNKLAAQAVGLPFPTYGSDPAFKAAFGYGPNEATIMTVENAFGGTNWAWIVAGWEAADTRNACTVLKDYNTYKANLKGDQVIVKSAAGVITVSAPTVAAAPAPAANATV
jgi:hypothetical protein